MHPISKDLPEFLHSKFSKIYNNRTRPSGKLYKSSLTYGVSEETPDFFKISQIPIVDKNLRTKLHNQLDKNPYRSLTRKLSMPDSSPDTLKETLKNMHKSRAGLSTGFHKHQGEFLNPGPKITRILSHEFQLLQKLPKRKTKWIKNEKKTQSEVPVMNVYKIRKKHTKQEAKSEDFINPPELSYHDSRVLYKLS